VPRRHRAARERPAFQQSRGSGAAAPLWAEAAGYSVRQVAGDKAYRCPGCQGTIRPGELHLVVVPDGDPDLRRHWHTPCWRQERRRRG
jgi:hypothetical protein